MGCFNQTAFISNIALTAGDPCVLIFMIKNKYTNGKDVHACYHTDNYQPAFFPIFGEYDDYGKIDNIEEDDNVKFIESYFGLTIDEVISGVDDKLVGRGSSEEEAKKNNDVLEKLVFTLEHREIYNLMIQNTKENSWFVNGDVTQYFLEDILGMVLEENPTDDKRYTMKYLIPNCDKYEIHSDGSWAQLYSTKNKTYVNDFSFLNDDCIWGIYHPIQFVKMLDKVSGLNYESKIHPVQKEMSLYEHRINVTILHQAPLIKAKPLTSKAIEKRKEESRRIFPNWTEEQIELYTDVEEKYDLFKKSAYKHEEFITSNRYDRIEFIKPYKKEAVLFNPKLRKNFIEFLNFDSCMACNSITYKLSNYHGQEVDWNFYVSFYEKALEISKNQLKEYNDNNEEY